MEPGDLGFTYAQGGGQSGEGAIRSTVIAGWLQTPNMNEFYDYYRTGTTPGDVQHFYLVPLGISQQ